MAIIWFTYSLQWDGDRTPGRRSGQVGMEGQSFNIEIDLPPEDFHENLIGAATALWSVETQFLQTVTAHYPEHRLVTWQSHLGSETGPQLSSFRCGFTASE